MTRRRALGSLFLLVAFLGMGCSAIVSRTTNRLAGSLSDAMLSQRDPGVIRDGAPAYLILLDALVRESPDDPKLLMAAGSLYATYAGTFVDTDDRASVLASAGLDYARRALCLLEPGLCDRWRAPFDEFEATVQRVPPQHVDALYETAAAWATWIQIHRDDWAAVGDKARVEAMIQRVLAIDPTYADGDAELYLGVLSSLLPASLGGKPEEGRRHFERAIELSGGRNLYAKVLFAEHYARTVFDKTLHDRLCSEVAAADPVETDRTLANVLAQQRAKEMLASSDDYFPASDEAATGE
jgi:tetratricopeptide (TPR) repeat protein